MNGYLKTFNVKNNIKNIKLHPLRVYNDRYIQPKIRTYSDKVYTNFHSLNVSEDDIECESFLVISIDSSLVYKSKHYLQANLDDCAYEIVDKRMIEYLNGDPFETDEN